MEVALEMASMRPAFGFSWLLLWHGDDRRPFDSEVVGDKNAEVKLARKQLSRFGEEQNKSSSGFSGVEGKNMEEVES